MFIKLYADDVKLYSNVNSDASNDYLQEQLNRLSLWAKDWQMPISYKNTCCVFSIGNNKIGAQYSLDNYTLDIVSRVTDLGVILNKNLKSSEHVEKLSRRAHGRASLIIKCFESRNIVSLVTAFNVYVRPILEYCLVVWNPCLIKDINAIEGVQRRFTKRLPGMRELPYHQRLVRLGLESLELRRLRIDLVYLYKIVFGLVKLDLCNFFVPRFNNNLIGHCYKLNLPSCNSNTRANFFSYRIINAWNALPASDTNFSSLIAFQNSLKSEYLVKFCKVFFA